MSCKRLLNEFETGAFADVYDDRHQIHWMEAAVLANKSAKEEVGGVHYILVFFPKSTVCFQECSTYVGQSLESITMFMTPFPTLSVASKWHNVIVFFLFRVFSLSKYSFE